MQEGSSNKVQYHSKSVSQTAPLVEITTNAFHATVDISLFQFRNQSHSFFNGTAADFSPSNATSPNRTKKFSDTVIDDIQKSGKRIKLGAYAERCRISPDGTSFALAREESLSLFSLGTGKLIWTLKLDRPSTPAFSQNGKYLIARNQSNVYAVESAGGRLLMSRESEYYDSSMAVSNDGNLAIAGLQPLLNGIAVWDSHTGQLLFSKSGRGPTQRYINNLATLFSAGFTCWCIALALILTQSNSTPIKPNAVSIALPTIVFLVAQGILFMTCQIGLNLFSNVAAHNPTGLSVVFLSIAIGLSVGCFLQVSMTRRFRRLHEFLQKNRG